MKRNGSHDGEPFLYAENYSSKVNFQAQKE